MSKLNKIEIFDSTLRDGAQSESVCFSLEDKLKIIKGLDDFGVDYIEAGNPSSNPKELEVFKKAVSKNAQLVAFGATVRKGLSPREDEGIGALLAADTKTIAVFGKSHDLQVECILRASLEENISMIRRTVEYLIRQGRQVIFDAEHFFDGYRSNPEYALETIKTAVKAGARTIVLCDTNGGCFPDEIAEITANAVSLYGQKNPIETAHEAGISVGIHCHNDTECAVANSIAAVKSGAVHVQGTFIGIGERCGNANLSALIPNLQLKLGYHCVSQTRIETITETAQFIAQVSNVRLSHNMAYVGKAAFAHKGGMHVDAVLKSPKSFEHIEPESVGNQRNVLLSEMSGRGAMLAKISEIAGELPAASSFSKQNTQIIKITDKIKALEHKGYQFEAANASFELLVLKELKKFKPFFEIVDYNINSSLSGAAIAAVKIKVEEHYEITADEGQGPVNAIDKALRKALEVFYPDLRNMRLTDYKVRIINGSDNTAAVTRVLIESTDGRTSWTTVGAGDNIISASMIALVDSIEFMLLRGSGS
jgi:2-isopropylmalate synthase